MSRPASNPPTVHLERRLHAARVAQRMLDAGLPAAFIITTLDLVRDNRGIYELMVLWEDADTSNDRDEAVADIQELIEDHKEAVPEKQKPYIPFDQLDEVAQRVLAHKSKLREIIDKHGGVTRVAELCGIPQPSLSRMLRSASMPRRSTLYKIAEALGVPETEIIGEFTW